MRAQRLRTNERHRLSAAAICRSPCPCRNRACRPSHRHHLVAATRGVTSVSAVFHTSSSARSTRQRRRHVPPHPSTRRFLGTEQNARRTAVGEPAQRRERRAERPIPEAGLAEGGGVLKPTVVAAPAVAPTQIPAANGRTDQTVAAAGSRRRPVAAGGGRWHV
eukprot:SAG11_NODE_2776_length_2983_cov_2.095354_5_plen_163_part_00